MHRSNLRPTPPPLFTRRAAWSWGRLPAKIAQARVGADFASIVVVQRNLLLNFSDLERLPHNCSHAKNSCPEAFLSPRRPASGSFSLSPGCQAADLTNKRCNPIWKEPVSAVYFKGKNDSPTRPLGIRRRWGWDREFKQPDPQSPALSGGGRWLEGQELFWV